MFGLEFIAIKELIVLGLALGGAAAARENARDQREPSYNPPSYSTTASSSVHASSSYFEKRTVWDWWGNGLAGWQREYLLQVGYNERSSTYALADLKRVAKYHEKELLTEKSKYYIREWELSLDSSDEEDERVVNCSKKDSPVWKGMKHYRGDIKTNGESGKDRRFYRWDNTHNDIEVYNGRGEHFNGSKKRGNL